MQIHKDFGVSFFAEHIRAVTERYVSKLVAQFRNSSDIYADRGLTHVA
jgi:hypothetical protein